MTMDPILNIGAAGLESSEEKVKALMNRMVNAETPGFKSSDVVIRSFPLELEAAQRRVDSMAPRVTGTYYNYLPGALIKTGRRTDLALGADGFFVVMCPWGEGYTRDGRFIINKDGQLVSVAGGYPLVGQSGPLSVDPTSKIDITQEGEIKVDGVIIDRIRVVNFPNKQDLESVNGVVFKDPNNILIPSEVEAPRIVQGYIEASNANVIEQMMELVYLSKLYSLNSKIVQTRDTALSRAVQMGAAQ